MKVGIIGLPNVGKTTLFNALARAHAPSENYPFCTVVPNEAAVAVPDIRLNRLAALLHPQKVIPAHVEFLDVPGLVEGASRGEGMGNRFLGHVREAHLLAQVVRCFTGPAVAYQLPSIDPARECEIVATELLLADLDSVDRALAGKHGDAEREGLLGRLRDALARGKALREEGLSSAEASLAGEFGFLTLKPLLIVANMGEGRSETERRWAAALSRAACGMGAQSIEICSAAEEALSGLAEEEASEFLKEMGLAEKALPRLIARCHSLLNLISFFTVENNIVQAWSVPAGTTAPRAAGRIHTDMERGFIRAEVIGFHDLERSGDMGRARSEGLLRTVGKEYVMRDGDVVRFRFSPP